MHTGRRVRSHAAVNYILINVNDKHYAGGEGQPNLTKQPLIHSRLRQGMMQPLEFEPDNSTENSNVKL